MPSAAAAGTGGGHDHSAGNHDDVTAIRTASTHLTAVKARTATTLDLDDHVSRGLAWCKRQGLRGASR